MTVGNANFARPLNPNAAVNDGDSFTDNLWLAQRPQIGPRRYVIPLRINGQVLNVSENVRTVTHVIQQVGLIHHVQRTYTVHSQNHAPIQGVTQSDVLNAIRLYDAQQAAQRQQAAGQPARGP
ncbi:MAG: hypothetical protein ACRC9R_02505, partial [Enterovibrio sp.]